MIKLKHVSKSYNRKHILSDISLTIDREETVSFSGPSGSGKTTLLNIISGILKPDSGRVILESKNIGYSFQNDVLLKWKTVRENITFALSSACTKDEAEKRSDIWLERVGLENAKNKKPGELSGGMKKRLNIARSLAVEPDILILDEPFAYLDRENISMVQDIIKEAQNTGTTILLVTHSPELITGISHRTVSINSIQNIH